MGRFSKHGGAAIYLITTFLILHTATTHAKGPATLVLFEHENRVAPNKTVVTTASPSGNFTIQFGAINVIANVLRAGIEPDSTVLGRALGQVTFEDDLSLSLAFSFVVSTPAYNGTLTAQGVLDPSGDGEIVITGGTGDFRWARGYAEVLTVSTEPADVVFKNTLYLSYYGGRSHCLDCRDLDC